MRIVWQAETDLFCNAVLRRHWPDVLRIGDVRNLLPNGQAVLPFETGEIEGVDLVCGGDSCPCRSLARAGRPTAHPDLSGWFLAMVGRLRPRWVVRENVPAPDVVDFRLALETLGYGTLVIGLDSRDFTSQSRRREFVIGCPPALRPRLAGVISKAAQSFGFDQKSRQAEASFVACLTAHSDRMELAANYCYEPGKGVRFLDPAEAEALQGFPRGWTSGFSRTCRHRMLGNAVTVPVARWIGERVLEAEGL
jgi:DNA (cytosine-5)-methyltransferase 1